MKLLNVNLLVVQIFIYFVDLANCKKKPINNWDYSHKFTFVHSNDLKTKKAIVPRNLFLVKCATVQVYQVSGTTLSLYDDGVKQCFSTKLVDVLNIVLSLILANRAAKIKFNQKKKEREKIMYLRFFCASQNLKMVLIHFLTWQVKFYA